MKPWSEVSGAELDYWTGRAVDNGVEKTTGWGVVANGEPWSPTSDWSDCGPLLDKFGLDLRIVARADSGKWTIWVARPAFIESESGKGGTPQEAICRAVCAAKWPDGVPRGTLPVEQA